MLCGGYKIAISISKILFQPLLLESNAKNVQRNLDSSVEFGNSLNENKQKRNTELTWADPSNVEANSEPKLFRLGELWVEFWA